MRDFVETINQFVWLVGLISILCLCGITSINVILVIFLLTCGILTMRLRGKK
jgi:hypothetical protein